MLTGVHCWCGNTELEPFSPTYLRCPICHTLTLRQWPDINADQVTDDPVDLYGKDYYLTHLPQKYGYPGFDVRVRNDLPERCLYWLRTLLNYKLPPAKALEIGSAHGAFVAMLGWAGFDAMGLELSPWIVDYSERTFGIRSFLGPVESQDIPSGSLDVIVLMDVLEHLPNPVATMHHCLNLLRPDGILLIQTPAFPEDKSYEEMKKEGHPFLEQMKEEEHLYLFSPRSIRSFFQRLEAEQIAFEKAIFDHYDMFLAVSRVSQIRHPQEAVDEALSLTPGGRLILALLDLQRERAARSEVIRILKDNLQEVEKDRAARLEVIQALDGELRTMALSRSWKWTAPFRRMMQILTTFRGGHGDHRKAKASPPHGTGR